MRGAASAAQQRFYARHQLARFEWLGDIVVGARLQTDHAIDRIAGCGEHDYANAGGPATQPARKGKTVFRFAEMNVEESEVRHCALSQLLHFGPRGQGSGPQSVLRQAFCDDLSLERVVLDQDDFSGASHTTPLPSRRVG